MQRKKPVVSRQLGNNCFDFIIKDGIFKKNFHVFIGNRKNIVDYFDKLNLYKPLKGADMFPENYAGLYSSLQEVDESGQGPSKISLIWIDSIDYGDLVHECFHAIADSLKIDGISLSSETEEVFSYYLSFLFSSIEHEIKKRGFLENTKVWK